MLASARRSGNAGAPPRNATSPVQTPGKTTWRQRKRHSRVIASFPCWVNQPKEKNPPTRKGTRSPCSRQQRSGRARCRRSPSRETDARVTARRPRAPREATPPWGRNRVSPLGRRERSLGRCVREVGGPEADVSRAMPCAGHKTTKTNGSAKRKRAQTRRPAGGRRLASRDVLKPGRVSLRPPRLPT